MNNVYCYNKTFKLCTPKYYISSYIKVPRVTDTQFKIKMYTKNYRKNEKIHFAKL